MAEGRLKEERRGEAFRVLRAFESVLKEERNAGKVEWYVNVSCLL